MSHYKHFQIIEDINVPFDIYPTSLYTTGTLYEGYVRNKPETYEQCFDQQVYEHFIRKGKRCNESGELMARALHDQAITLAMYDFLSRYDEKCIVGIMGGHGILRTSEEYKQVVFLSKILTELGSLMVSGGGPGAMEATHLGAWMAGFTVEETLDAIEMVSAAPSFRDEGWLDTAFSVREKYFQSRYESLGIPTWLYGHEPANVFATQIAKYFTNSIREDEILTIAMGGIIYTPGSAGTMQEVFQDAVQNHYLSFGYSSPMIFMNSDFWTKEMPIFKLFEYLIDEGKYKNLILLLSDSIEEIVKKLMAFRGEWQRNCH
ncbi:MAG: hypothetical protein PUD83_04445 [Bacteroidales bacterium]|nr:hypothetical protein [Bacteroidales bacterium]